MIDLDKYKVFSSMFKIHRHQFHALYSVFDQYGIHPGQIPMIFKLFKHKELNQKELAEKTCVKPSTITIMLRKMEKSGLIEKKTDKNDRRIYIVSLTEKGSDIVKKLSSLIENLEENSLKGISEEEQDILFRLLDKILTNLKQLNNKQESGL